MVKKQLVLLFVFSALSCVQYTAGAQDNAQLKHSSTGNIRRALNFTSSLAGKVFVQPIIRTRNYVANRIPSLESTKHALSPRTLLSKIIAIPSEARKKCAAFWNALWQAPTIRPLFYLQSTTGANDNAQKINGLRQAYEAYGDQIAAANSYVAKRTITLGILASAIGSAGAYQTFGSSQDDFAGVETGILAGLLTWYFSKRTRPDLIEANGRKIAREAVQASLTEEQANAAYSQVGGGFFNRWRRFGVSGIIGLRAVRNTIIEADQDRALLRELNHNQ